MKLRSGTTYGETRRVRVAPKMRKMTRVSTRSATKPVAQSTTRVHHHMTLRPRTNQ